MPLTNLIRVPPLRLATACLVGFFIAKPRTKCAQGGDAATGPGVARSCEKVFLFCLASHLLAFSFQGQRRVIVSVLSSAILFHFSAPVMAPSILLSTCASCLNTITAENGDDVWQLASYVAPRSASVSVRAYSQWFTTIDEDASVTDMHPRPTTG